MTPLLGKFSFKANVRVSQRSQTGGKWADTVTLPNSFFVLAVGSGGTTRPRMSSFPLFSQPGCHSSPLYWLDNLSSCPSLWANRYWNLLPVFMSRTAVTHQRAVVQESAGEVAVEAEGQDVPVPGAQSHFLLWTHSVGGELCVSKATESCMAGGTHAQLHPGLIHSTPTATSTQSGNSHMPATLTIQPGHTGVMNFELLALQILHGKMGAQ